MNLTNMSVTNTMSVTNMSVTNTMRVTNIMSIINTMNVTKLTLTNIMSVINTINVTNIMSVPTIVKDLRHPTAAEPHFSFNKRAACMSRGVLQLQKSRHLYNTVTALPHTSPFS